METIAKLVLQNMADGFPVGGFILMGLGSIVVLAQAYVAATPSTQDDAWFAKLEDQKIIGGVLRALTKFAVVGRSEPEVKLDLQSKDDLK